MRRSFTAVLGALALTAAAVVAAPVTASAEPGDLDGTFGNCGLLVGAAYAVGPTDGQALIGRSDHKFVSSSNPNGGTVIERLLEDGTPDESFGHAGRVVLPNRWTAALDAADRVLLHQNVRNRITFRRLSDDGTFDSSFGTGGTTTLESKTLGVRVQPRADGKLWVLAGFLYRLLPDGEIDPAFPRFDGLFTRVLPDDTLFTDTFDQQLGESVAVNRFDGDGRLLFSRAITHPPVGDVNTGFRSFYGPRPDGSLVVATVIEYGSSLVRDRVSWSHWFPDGTLDAAFGTAGYRYTNLSNAGRVIFDGDGASFVETSPVIGTLRWTKFTANGDRDRSFGTRSTAGYSLGVPASFETNTVHASARYETFRAMVPQINNTQLDESWFIRTSLASLERGAGLVLQWDGTAWPTRWGTDPGPECPFDTPYWPDDNNARGITTVAGQGGYEVDLFGGIHPFSIGRQHTRPAPATGAPYWPGWDIVRGIAAKSDGTGGYTLDAYGGIHPFHTGSNPQPPPAVRNPYWPGADITRGIALMPDGTSGYILDLYGGIHRFTTPGRRLPPRVVGNPYWPGFDIARGISILDDGTGGYTVDGYGGIHPFALGNHTPPPPPTPGQAVPYLPGVDWVRGFTFIPPKPATVTGTSTSATAPKSGNANALDALVTSNRPTPGREPR